jgi:hypothetical protein
MAFLATIGFMILAIVLGRRTKASGLPHYLIIALIALVQVCLVLYDVFTSKPPTLP